MDSTLELDGIHLGRIYRDGFEAKLLPEIEKSIYDFLCGDGVTKQMRRIANCDEVWIKPNLTNPRPPETGCITHPVAVKAILDYLLRYLKIEKPIKIVETITYHKGAGMPEILAKLPERERMAIEEKIKQKKPEQDMHDFGFELLLELSGLGKLVKTYEAEGKDVRVLNLSKEPVMTLDEKARVTKQVETLIGPDLLPKQSIRKKILDKLPRAVADGRAGIISLTLPKTHDEPQAWMTGTIKNIALGLYPDYKAFMHKDLARAMIYHYAFWKIGLKNNIIGIFSGPFGQDGEGPIFGRTVDFPYIVAGSDLLKLDAVVVALVSSKPGLVNQLNTFRYGDKRIGSLPTAEDLRKVMPYGLNFQPYPYKNSPCCEEA